jgi:hypothetical protein
VRGRKSGEQHDESIEFKARKCMKLDASALAPVECIHQSNIQEIPLPQCSGTYAPTVVYRPSILSEERQPM